MANEVFAKRLKELRKNRSMTQRDLANALGVSMGSIGFYENQERTPDIDFLNSVADFFDVSTEYLLGRTDIKSQDIDVRTMSEKLGLSEEVLIKIKHYIDPDYPIYVEVRDSDEEGAFSVSDYNMSDVINMVMENSLFFALLK